MKPVNGAKRITGKGKYLTGGLMKYPLRGKQTKADTEKLGESRYLILNYEI